MARDSQPRMTDDEIRRLLGFLLRQADMPQRPRRAPMCEALRLLNDEPRIQRLYEEARANDAMGKDT